MKGYTGKILRIDLTSRKISTIDTKKYEEWGGGHGIGSAIFWDLCKNKAISAFDPGNVVTLMTSPLSGTLTPSASSRTEVQGIGAQPYPIEWFTRSNFGGRFGAMLKYAGWDGIVIEGKADKPVWVDIKNDNVQIKDAGGLWGLDTWETQQKIWDEVDREFGEWYELSSLRDGGRTTQRPAVVTIGPAGENLTRIAALVHDGGSGAGQGGFGGVWGSKNLKAISVIGTGSVEVADPKALLQARIEFQKQQYNVDNPLRKATVDHNLIYLSMKAPGIGGLAYTFTEESGPKGCTGCFFACRRRTKSGKGNDSSCADLCAVQYATGLKPDDDVAMCDVAQRLGINTFFMGQVDWLYSLYKMGVMGPGKQIDSDWPFDKFPNTEFVNKVLYDVAYRKGIGDVLAEGFPRAAEKWGRLGDLDTGLLRSTFWGYMEHYDPRLEVEWSYGSILGDRDINEHGNNLYVHWIPYPAMLFGVKPMIDAETMVKVMAESLVPYKDPLMLDYSEKGIYSEAKAKMIAWQRHYNLFWKNSVLYCDWVWPGLFNFNHPEYKGYSPEGEPLFFNTVTGKKLTFEEGMEIGRKIWNLDRAIYALQGRHRDMEKLAGYVHKVPTNHPYPLPFEENGKWRYDDCLGRVLDEEKFEEWRTKYYKLEGWDIKSGWPTRTTLESLGLKHVADELEKHSKLGVE